MNMTTSIHVTPLNDLDAPPLVQTGDLQIADSSQKSSSGTIQWIPMLHLLYILVCRTRTWWINDPPPPPLHEHTHVDSAILRVHVFSQYHLKNNSAACHPP